MQNRPAEKTIVLQSHRPERLRGWMAQCCASVENWAQTGGFAYARAGDELFDRLPAALRERHRAQPVVLSDLARLLWLAEALDDGFGRAIWCDADVLVFGDLTPADSGDAFGRECWVQHSRGRLRSYRKIHNAWMQFTAASPVLPFYIDRAQALLARAESPVVPQFIGPKLLTAWHNIVPFAVEEQVGMLSPRVTRELLHGGDEALDLLRRGHAAPLRAANLSASCAGCEVDGITLAEADYARLVDGLLAGSLGQRLR